MRILLAGSAILMVSMASAFAQGKETRKVEDFTRLSVGIAADLILKQGNACSVEIQAEQKMLDLIVTEVENGKLRIRYSKPSVMKHEKVTIWVVMKDVEGLAVSGSGDITCEGELKSNELDLAVSGSGNIVLRKLAANEIDAAISGSGGIELAGSNAVNELDISISGSGRLLAESLSVNEMSCRVSGSGNCKVNVTGQLNATISGSGNVYCSGNPRIDARVSGSGKVITK